MNDKVKGCMALLVLCILAMILPSMVYIKDSVAYALSVLGMFGCLISFICALIAIFGDNP